MATAQAIEVQQGLNEVVMNRVHRMIDDKAVGVQATTELLRSIPSAATISKGNRICR